MSIYYDPSLTMGQRIMNHKFAKMSIWEFLGWRPKETATDPEITIKEAEDLRWENRLKNEKYFIDLELARYRTTEEWLKIGRYRELCTNVMFRLADEFQSKPEWDKAWKEWVLSETYPAYLPLCFGKILKKMKVDNKYLPSTHMLLI